MPGKYVYQRMKKVPGKPGFWPERKKTEAVVTWMSTGNMTLTAAMINVPRDTLNKWRKMPWWKEIEQSIKDEDNQELDAKFSKIIKKTLDTIDDRLENGNFQFNPKTGKTIRIPVNLRDTHRVMSDLVDKRKVIRNEPTTSESKEGTNDRLLKLASQFAEMVKGIKDTEMKQVGEIYEGDYDAVHDQRETGLQAGAELGAQEQAEPSEGPSESKQGEVNDG